MGACKKISGHQTKANQKQTFDISHLVQPSEKLVKNIFGS